MRYSLPLSGSGDNARGEFAISLCPTAGHEPWEFSPEHNRRLMVRYLFELLKSTSLAVLPAHDVVVPKGFRRQISFVMRRTRFGNQELWLEPYYLDASQQYGFLVDFSFHKAADVPYSRDVQRLSLSLDSSYKSNRNSYIDREAAVSEFLGRIKPAIFPLSAPELDYPLDLSTEMVQLPSQRLAPKIFVLGSASRHESQWRGLEAAGPLTPVAGDVCFVMFYRRDHRGYAEDLYRALTGKAANVAFAGLKKIFRLDVQQFRAVTVPAWTEPELDAGIREIAEIKREMPGTKILVLMIEDKENSAIYYAAKYGLLELGVPLQVVSAQLIQRKESLKWSASNIALQVFAKLGGEPWRVQPSHLQCLIIGVGQAHRLGVTGIEKYFAYCIATDSSGLYKKIAVLGNDSHERSYLQALQASLTRELNSVPESYTSCVIHVPFKLRRNELEAIDQAVHAAAADRGPSLRFVVIKINDDHKYFGYADTNSRIPVEGSVICLSSARASYLVWFEGLKHDRDVVRKSVGGPLHIEFLWPRNEISPSEQLAFLQDIFNLSGTNWRGFNAKSIPISTYYCALIAKFVAEFPSQLARIEASQEPWFL